MIQPYAGLCAETEEPFGVARLDEAHVSAFVKSVHWKAGALMAHNRSALLLAVIGWAIATAASAQTLPPLAGVEPSTSGPAHTHGRKDTHKPPRPVTPHPAAAAAGEEAERAAALARARKKFFESPPDREQQDSSRSSTPFLGGSNGLTPGMQFKF